MNHTIMIVENELDIQQFLTAALKQFGFRPIAYSQGRDALKAFESHPPDLILLDVQLPDMSGFDICEQIRKQSHVPIIFVSCLNDGTDIIHGLEIGGDDYVTKPFDLHQLIARIRSNLRRAPLVPSFTNPQFMEQNEMEEMSFGPLKLNYSPQRVIVQNKQVTLTTKEFHILSALAQQPDKVFSAHELYKLIWGEDSLGETQALKVHISHIRKKLDSIPGHSVTIQSVRGFGYQIQY